MTGITTASSTASVKTFQWIGGPTLILRLGPFKVLTDPMLSPKSDRAFIIAKHPTTGEPNAPIKRLVAPAEFDRSGIDLLLVSHPHADHFDQEARDQLDKTLFVIGPAIDKQTFMGWGFSNFEGIGWGQSAELKKDGQTLRITAVEARHAANDPLKTELGRGNGYVIEYFSANEVFRIYWTGDTVWIDEMKGYAKFGPIDLLIPNMGSVGSDGKIGRRGLNANDCLLITEALSPNLIIPVHHTTFSMYVEPIIVLKETIDATLFRGRVKILEPGVICKLQGQNASPILT